MTSTNLTGYIYTLSNKDKVPSEFVSGMFEHVGSLSIKQELRATPIINNDELVIYSDQVYFVNKVFFSVKSSSVNNQWIVYLLNDIFIEKGRLRERIINWNDRKLEAIQYDIDGSAQTYSSVLSLGETYPLWSAYRYIDFNTALNFYFLIRDYQNKRHDQTIINKFNSLKLSMHPANIPEGYQPPHTLTSCKNYKAISPYRVAGILSVSGTFSIRTNLNNIKTFGNITFRYSPGKEGLDYYLIAIAETIGLDPKVVVKPIKKGSTIIKLEVNNRKLIADKVVPFFKQYRLRGDHAVSLAKINDILPLLNEKSNSLTQYKIINIWKNNTSELNKYGLLIKPGWN